MCGSGVSFLAKPILTLYFSSGGAGLLFGIQVDLGSPFRYICKQKFVVWYFGWLGMSNCNGTSAFHHLGYMAPRRSHDSHLGGGRPQ
jgi:hypothetical protein